LKPDEDREKLGIVWIWAANKLLNRGNDDGSDGGGGGGGGIVGSAGGGLMSWLFGENWAMYARIIIILILFGFVMKIRRMFR